MPTISGSGSIGATRFDIDDTDDFFAGVDQTIQIDVDDAADADLNMGTFALTWELMPSPTEAAVITKTTSDGISIGNGTGTNDRATITVGDGDTEASTVGAGRYYHRLRRTDAGNEEVYSYGDVILKPNTIS